jgi:type IV pilus assembly protein PilV
MQKSWFVNRRIGMRQKSKILPKNPRDNSESGFTLVEVIFAITILAVGLLAVATMQTSAIRGNHFASDVTSAMDRVQDRVDKLLAVNIGHADLTAGDHTDPGDRYDISWTVADNTPIFNVKTITVTASWTDRGVNKTHAFQFMRTEL